MSARGRDVGPQEEHLEAELDHYAEAKAEDYEEDESHDSGPESVVASASRASKAESPSPQAEFLEEKARLLAHVECDLLRIFDRRKQDWAAQHPGENFYAVRPNVKGRSSGIGLATVMVGRLFLARGR